MSAPALMAAVSLMCSACGVYAAVRRELPGQNRSIRDRCAICLANEAYARSEA